MSGRMMNIHAAKICVALALAAAAASCAPTPPEEPPLKGALIGGPFTLTDQNGKTVKDTDFVGKYRLIYFGYTSCPDVCPVDVAKLMGGLRMLEKTAPDKAPKIQPIFITVDPALDTPTALKPFVARYHPRLIGLTGSEDAIAKVAKSYLMSYQKQPPGDPKEPDRYIVAHKQLAYLMDPNGAPIALIPVDDISTDADEGPPAIVAAELDRWVR